MNADQQRWSSEDGVHEDLLRQPHIFLKLAENALTAAESLRDNYFKNTAAFITALRRSIQKAEREDRPGVLQVFSIADATWSEFQGEVVTFIDGGIGQVEISGQVPILLRVGSYTVRTGERRLTEREQFGYYPVILGDLEGGSKERRDFTDIVRITAELLGGLAALERNPDLDVLIFHGPLVYLVGSYVGHTPFTEADIDRFLQQYASSPTAARDLKEEFFREARAGMYRAMTENWNDWVQRRLFEPLSWMSFLYRRLIRLAQCRAHPPIIVGVVERGGSLTQFSERVLLERIFLNLVEKGNEHYFNRMYGRIDLTSPKNVLVRLGYTDALLLAMLLRPGEFSEPWEVEKYEGLKHGNVTLPGEPGASRVNFAPLRSGPYQFPRVRGCYVHISETTEPVRVEVFDELGLGQIDEAARRVLMYSRLLPGYGFPVGLDIADKFAKIPAWLTDGYSKLIRYHLGVSLQTGQVSDAEMRRIIVQAIYMTHRDWLFRPTTV